MIPIAHDVPMNKRRRKSVQKEQPPPEQKKQKTKMLYLWMAAN